MDKPREPPNEDASSTDDEEIDVYSKNFNPLKALYSKKFKIPVENAKKFDNVSM